MQASVLVRTCYCAHATLLCITCNISLGAQFYCAHATLLSIVCNISLGAHVLLRKCLYVIHNMQELVLLRKYYRAHATMLSINCKH